MHALTDILLLVLFTATRPTLCMEYKHEAHGIMKRMADGGEGFEGHDVARVHLVDGQGQLRRRLFRRDLSSIGKTIGGGHQRALQLALASGSTVNLTLTRAGIVGPETVVSFHTANGRVETNVGKEDCYSHGEVQDSTGKGWAAISHCDGVFGFAISAEYEYFVHPVGGARSKRDVESDEIYDVHVLWRRTDSKNGADDVSKASDQDGVDKLDVVVVPNKYGMSRRLRGTDADRLNATGIVVELAMFTDQKYWQRLHYLYPDREDDYLLVRLAGTQALYSNRQKVGYDVQIKLKLMEYWTENPKGYKFTDKLGRNLKSFCRYTKNRYFYDIHALNTGVWKWNKGMVGLAYLKGACSQRRCFVSKGTELKTFVLYAHEMGHTLGMPHVDRSKCPKGTKTPGGFMGGAKRFNFSLCMKYMLGRFLNTSKSNCLFRETSDSKTPEEYSEQANVFPGQAKPPDELCGILAGSGYNYVPFGNASGVAVCQWMVCLNENKSSPAFGKARRFNAPDGFPCNPKSFCLRGKKCKPWKELVMAVDYRIFQKLTTIPQWSEWSAQFSDCSRSCGTGVRTRRRVCQYQDFNLAPYCPGMAVKAELCNTDACPGDPKEVPELRRVRGDEVCARFHENGVRLKLKGAKGYLPTSTAVRTRDGGARVNIAHSISCALKCVRVPSKVRGELDAFMPDGTPCLDSSKSRRDLEQNGISLRCVRGYCVEFSDCPDKDKCGVCGGDGSRCVELVFNSSYDVPKGKRSFLTAIPPGSSNVEVTMDKTDNRGVVLELYSIDNKRILGIKGLHQESTYASVPFAGAVWSYKRNAYIRTAGTTEEVVGIRAYRRKNPIQNIIVKYIKSPEVLETV